MAYLINEYCNSCGLCIPVCPNGAIAVACPVYRINPYFCTECLGFADDPQCADACPEQAIVPAPIAH